MFFYRIVVAYDGTSYHGWQFQPNATTISKVLIDSFYSVFFCNITLLGASRTDAGVHARGQVAIVQSPICVPSDKLMLAWNNDLPKDVSILSVQQLDDLVHPHAGVVQKTYLYHFFTKRPLPFFQRYGWHFKRSVDFNLLSEALRVFVGTHDFRSFSTGNDLKDTIRTIDSAKVEFVPEIDGYRIEIKGKSFLRYMVRRIVGACLEVASRDHVGISDLKKVLEEKNPCHTLPNSPAKGLVLYEIRYEGEGVGL